MQNELTSYVNRLLVFAWVRGVSLLQIDSHQYPSLSSTCAEVAAYERLAFAAPHYSTQLLVAGANVQSHTGEADLQQCKRNVRLLVMQWACTFHVALACMLRVCTAQQLNCPACAEAYGATLRTASRTAAASYLAASCKMDIFIWLEWLTM